MIRWVNTESGTRYGFFCDHCKAEIVREGVAASYGEGDSGEMVYLHKGTCDDEYRRFHGDDNGWNDISVFLTFLKNNAEIDLGKAAESVRVLGSPMGRDLEPPRVPPPGSMGHRS